jgi:hypothetical protein
MAWLPVSAPSALNVVAQARFGDGALGDLQQIVAA